MKTYAGIDLHSSNNYLGIIDDQDKRLFGQRLPNCIDTIVEALKPFRETLTGIAGRINIQLVLACRWTSNAGYQNAFGQSLCNQQYEGLKHTDDKWDSFWLAHMSGLVFCLKATFIQRTTVNT